MLKSILSYCIVFSFLFFLGKFVHIHIFLEDQLVFPLDTMYLYHYLFSLGVCTMFAYLAFNDILTAQLGIIYLVTLVLKLIFFAIIFKTVIFSEVPLPRVDRIAMLIPMLLFLSIEVLFISKILNKTLVK